MYIQKIKKVFIIFMILLIILLYLQYGRDMDVYNSYVFSAGTYHEQQLKVVINRLWVNNKRKCADEILQRCKENSFKSVDFCYDSYIPNELYVDVYLSDTYTKIGHPLFSFSYLPEDRKSEYNFLDDSEKYVLKIQ